MSFWIELDSNMKHIERETYSLLEWAGDIGGLYDGLQLLVGFFLAPIASFMMRIQLQ